MDSATAIQESPHASNRRPRIRNRLLVVLAAVVAATLVWAIAVPVLGLDVTVPMSYGSEEQIKLSVGPVIFMSMAATLAGWALLAILERFVARRAVLIWTIVAAIVFVVTLPWMPDAKAASIAVLAVLHVVVAGIVVIGLRRTSHAR